MIRQLSVGAIFFLGSLPAFGQEAQPNSRSAPIYRVTVIEHGLQAVNYQYRAGPTEIDFRGTVLLPKAKGRAVIESRRGSTDIDARFEKLTPPTPFGREYLTYVLWAISPEGAAHNLGEVVANGSDDAHMHVTTDLQAFGLLITAEPYAAVRQPSDVVVLENQVRPETIGKIEPVMAKTELLSRGHFTMDVQQSRPQTDANAPKVSMSEYEQLSQIYQAENAIGIARAAGADQLAADTFSKATRLLDEARRLHTSKASTSVVVQSARQAAQTADNARVIAEKRGLEAKLAKAQKDLATAQSEAERARADADASRSTRPPAASTTTPPPPPAPQPQAPVAAAPTPPRNYDNQPQVQTRTRLLEQLNSILATRDTPLGLVVTLSDLDFNGTTLQAAPKDDIGRVAGVITTHRGLKVVVEGHTDGPDTGSISLKRAEAVRDALVTHGLPANSIEARGMGNSRPTASNASATGRTENRRVEIVVSGDPIGNTALWDHAYNVTLR
jgi:outer membrane protein OmpA-like peptidoglycan-associated protein